MERFILEEIFRKKSNTFQSITFFPFLPKRPKFSALLVPGFMSREREKFKENFHRNFRTNGKRCLSNIYTKEHEISKKKSNGSRHSVYQSLMKCRLSFEAMYGFSTHFSSFIWFGDTLKRLFYHKVISKSITVLIGWWKAPRPRQCYPVFLLFGIFDTLTLGPH